MAKRKKKTRILAIAAVVLMLVSMIGAHLIQTSFGAVKVEEVRFDTNFGYQLSGLIYRPKDASAGNRVPGVIAVHGMYNNKEMQDANLVELSRRGYAVLAIDLFSHGDSDLLPAEDLLPMSGLAALQYFVTLPYVDTEHIGMTGHSMGGLNCDLATQMGVSEDGTPFVDALFLNCCFATYMNGEGKYDNIYGNIDVAILADKYDEFLFVETNADGAVLKAKDFIYSDNAQSFLNFGAEPSGAQLREANTLYTENIDGEEAVRVVYTPAYTHPWSHFSKTGTAQTLEFFDASLGHPNDIPSNQQIWQWKEAFNFIGLIGLAIFAANAAILLTECKPFAELHEECVAARPITTKRRKINLVAALGVAAFGAVSYIPIVIGLKGDTNGKILFAQNSTFALGMWVLICGLVAIAAMVATHKMNEEDGLSGEEIGLFLSRKKLGLTVAAAVIVTALCYLWILIADVLFKTDFRIWFMAAKTFTWKIFMISLFPNLLFFLVYAIANSVMINCFNFYEDESKKIANIIKQVLICLLPVLVIVVLQYVTLFATGSVLFSVYNGSSAHSMILWLFPMVLLIPAMVLIGRRVYEETKNPYYPAIINALLITFITCANTSSWA